MRDARAALDALREEERERRRREAEEAERIRQIQMREKLEVMRQKKQEYLQYQRQVLVLKYPGIFPRRQRLAGYVGAEQGLARFSWVTESGLSCPDVPT